MEKMDCKESFESPLAPLVHVPIVPTTRMPRLSPEDRATMPPFGDNSSGSNYLRRREKLRNVLAMMDQEGQLKEARVWRVQQQKRDRDAVKASRPARRSRTLLVPRVRHPRHNLIEADQPLMDVQLGRCTNGKTLTKCPRSGTEQDADEMRLSSKVRKFGKISTIAKTIVLLLRLCKTYILTAKDAETVKLFSAIDTAQAGKKYTIHGDLVFDATTYRTQKQDNVSSMTKRVLEMLPSARTEKDIHLVQVELQQMEFVSKHPMHMQRSLIRHGAYESYETGRVIIRHGRRPYAFYLVLAGSALLIEGDSANRSATPLFKGHAFGHEAIINRGLHNVTVISKQHIQLMSLTVEEYSRIFLAGGMSNISSADGSCFIETINIFQGWPVHLLKQHPNKCRFNYYTRGTVIEPDSNQSKWIYILKSGSCAVLKKLHLEEQVQTRRRRKRPLVSTRPAASLTISHQEQLSNKLRDMQRMRAKAFQGKSPRLTDTRPTNMLRIPVVDDPLSTKIDDDACVSSANHNKCLGVVNQRDGVPAIVVSKSSHCHIGSSIAADTRPQPVVPLRQVPPGKESVMAAEAVSVFNTFTSGFSARGPFLTHTIRLPKNNERQQCDTLESTFPSDNECFTEIRETRASLEVSHTSRFELEATQAAHHDDRLTTNQQVSTPCTKSQTCAEPRKIGRDVFVQIDTLEKCSVFGASNIVFSKQPSLCLVSNGSECILVAKKFYVKHATEANLKTINNLFRPYPSEDTLRRDLREKLSWQDHRKRALSDALRSLRRHRTKPPTMFERATHDH